jgi:hypothetical protein
VTFTPSGLHLEDLLLAGVGTLFGGLLVAAAVGALVGRWRGGTVGLSTALLMWGVGNLLVAATGVVLVRFDSQVLNLPVARCVPADGSRRPHRDLWLRLPAPLVDGQPRHVYAGRVPGVCPGADSPAPSEPVRVRNDDFAAPRATIRGELAHDDKPVLIGVLWGMFGGAGVLMGSLILGNDTPSRVPSPRPVAAWRRTIGELFGGLGLMLFLAAFIVPFFLDGGAQRQVQMGLRSVAAAMSCWVLAGRLAGTMPWGTVIFLLFFAGVMLGFAELIRHMGLG